MGARRDGIASRRSTLATVLPGLATAPADWREYTPAAITVSPMAGYSARFDAVRVTRGGEVTTWVGRNALPGASLVAIGKRDRWDATLTIIGGSFDIHVRGSQVSVIEHTTPLVCPGEYRSPAKVAVDAQKREALVRSPSGPKAAAVPIVGDPSIHTSGTTIYTVEVAYFYTKDLEDTVSADAGGLANVPAYLDSTFRAWNETHNLIIEQSKIPNMRWHYAGLHRVPDYTLEVADHNGDGGAARYSMTYDLNVFDGSVAQVEPGNAEAVAVDTLVKTSSAAHFADISVLMVGAPRTVGGLALINGNHCAVEFSGGALHVAHEIGHDFGLYHDRESDSIPDGNGWYNCGYLFHYNPKNFGGADYDQKFGDIMSYGAMAPFFSNPHVSVLGTELAAGSILLPDSNWYPMGVEVDQPRAAYAARWLWEHAQSKANRVTDPAQAFPALTAQPLAGVIIGTGGELRLAATAAGTNLTYQWRKDGVSIAGATGTSYTKANAGTADAGAYDVVVTNALGSVISRASAVTVSDAPLVSRLVNISTRSQVGTGNDVQIAGFVITGTQPKTVLVRAGSAVLTAAGLTGVLGDPIVELHSRTATIATNDDWSTDAATATEIRSAAVQVGAQAWADGTHDAAILIRLNPGLYTALVRGKNDTSGMAIVEVYEIDQVGSRMVNISTRAQVGTGDDVLIAGFVITGDSAKRVLIRGGSAVLGGAGLGNLLSDPLIELHTRTTMIATNDDWSTDPGIAAEIRSAAAQVGAQAWTDGMRGAALLVTLDPGLYTAMVKGRNDTTGMAIVEVYELPQ